MAYQPSTADALAIPAPYVVTTAPVTPLKEGCGVPDVVQTVAPIHGSIVKAICKIQTTLETIKKGNKNVHGGYMFASTDDVYAALTKKMGEVGLLPITLEDSCEIVRVEKEGKTSQWAKVTFSFILATAEATWTDPRARRTLFIQVTGPQTYQAAQSFAEKAWLRSLFKLATGDVDLDAMPQADSEEDQIALSQAKKRKSSASSKKDGGASLFNEIRRDIASAVNAEHAQHIRTVHAEIWAEMPVRWVELLDQEYEDKMASFEAAA